MKLPKVTYSGVQSMGRANLGALSAEASSVIQTGKVEQAAFNALADISADFIQRKENQEYNDQLVSMQLEMDEFRRAHGAKEFYTAEEVQHLGERARLQDSTVDDTGQINVVDRQDIPAYEVYPMLLQSKLEGVITDKASKITNPDLRRDFMQKAGISASDQLTKAVVAAEQAQKNYLFQLGQQNAMEAAMAGNIAAARFHISELETDDLTKRKLTESAELEAEKYHVTQAIRSSNPETVMAMRAMLEDENYSGSLPESARQAALGDLNGRLDQLGAEAEAEQKRQHSMVVNGFSVGIMDGQVTRMQLDAAYGLWKGNDADPNGLTPQEHSALVRQLKASQKASKDVANYAAITQGWLSGEVPADPSNTDHKKAMEWLVAQEGLTRDNVERMGELAAITGIIPEALKVKVNGYILNGDLEQAATGMNYYNNLQESAPHLVANLSQDTKDVARMGTQFMDAGLSQQDAIELARQYHSEVTPELEDVYREMWREADVNMKDALEDFMDDDPMFDVNWVPGTDVGADPAMHASFQVMTRHYYPLVKGDMKKAQQMAYEAVQEEWGMTGVGLQPGKYTPGNRASRFPPERLYNASTEQVNVGLEMFAEAEGIDFNKIILAPDMDTPRNRSYPVILYNEADDDFDPHPTRFNGSEWIMKGFDRDWTKQMEIEKYKSRSRELVNQQALQPADALP